MWAVCTMGRGTLHSTHAFGSACQFSSIHLFCLICTRQPMKFACYFVIICILCIRKFSLHNRTKCRFFACWAAFVSKCISSSLFQTCLNKVCLNRSFAQTISNAKMRLLAINRVLASKMTNKLDSVNRWTCKQKIQRLTFTNSEEQEFICYSQSCKSN